VSTFDDDHPLPWRAGHVVVTSAGVGLGAVGVLVSWWAVSRTARLSSQIGWMNLGAAGLMVVGATLAMWVLAGRRAIGQRQARLEAALDGVVARRRVRPVPVTKAAAGRRAAVVEATGDDAPPERWVWARGMTRYHREGCQLVQGKQVRIASLGVHERSGRRPCGMCASNGRSAS
jgi:hypothetical protein